MYQSLQVETCHDKRNYPCVFPFKYDGLTYTNCSYEGTGIKNPWCAIQVNPTTYEYKYWGYCQMVDRNHPNGCKKGMGSE